MCERTIDGASDGSRRSALEAVSWAVRVWIWDCRVRIWVCRRVCVGLGGEVVVLGVGVGVEVVAVAVEGEVDEVDGWVLTVVEIGGVVRGRACAAVEGSCRSGISIIGSSSVCEVALSDSADNAEESGGDVDADVDCTVNPPSSGSSRRSSKSEE